MDLNEYWTPEDIDDMVSELQELREEKQARERVEAYHTTDNLTMALSSVAELIATHTTSTGKEYATLVRVRDLLSELWLARALGTDLSELGEKE